MGESKNNTHSSAYLAAIERLAGQPIEQVRGGLHEDLRCHREARHDAAARFNKFWAENFSPWGRLKNIVSAALN